MTRLDGKEVCAKAIDTFGAEHQQIVAIEEFCEAVHEVCKVLRGKGDREHLSEEMADALICLDTLMLIHDNESAVTLWKEYKLSRLEARIEKERAKQWRKEE